MKIKEIYKTLLKEYSFQGWWPLISRGGYHPKDYELPCSEDEILEVILGALLTQNTSWRNAEKAVKNLAKKNLIELKKLEEIKTEELASIIKPAVFFNQKARLIKRTVAFLKTCSIKDVKREDLLKIKGIGPETADSILLYAGKKPYFVVDTYTKRIFSRLGLCKEETTYHKIQELIEKSIKKDVKMYNEFHALLVEHAKRYCKKKPTCSLCPLREQCEYTKKSFYRDKTFTKVC